MTADVLRFGAVGDGVTDDTAAIQAAVNATVNGVVFLPPGTYRVAPPPTRGTMTGIQDLFASLRGIFCLVLVLAATAFVILDKMTVEQWIDFAKWIAITLVASKTVTGAIELVTAPKATTARTPVSPPSPPA